MDEAFLSLLEQKDFAFITVKELCECAGVSRSTFYLHYETMNDLLSESVAYIHAQFFERFPAQYWASSLSEDTPAESLHLLTPEYLNPYLDFIRAHRKLYRTAIENPSLFRTEEIYAQMFSRVFDRILERYAIPERERHYRMKFYLSGIAAIVENWLRGGCVDSTDALADLIRRCAEGQ